jgi:hypothetical protein
VSEVTLVIFTIFLLNSIGSVIRRFRIIAHLKAKHPKTYNDLGQPSRLGRPKLFANNDYLSFMLHEEWKKIKDPRLSRLSKNANLLALLNIVLFLAGMVSYSLSNT